MRVMIVDDDNGCRDMLEQMIRSKFSGRAEVCAVNCAKDALNVLHDAPERFHVFIIDLVMPGSIGGEILGLMIKESDPNAVTVLFTGSEDDDFLPYYNYYKFDLILSKRRSIESLNRIVKMCSEVEEKQQLV
jgi:DNA-binding NtrC family response regulator